MTALPSAALAACNILALHPASFLMLLLQLLLGQVLGIAADTCYAKSWLLVQVLLLTYSL
jgi:hypothetical protein